MKLLYRNTKRCEFINLGSMRKQKGGLEENKDTTEKLNAVKSLPLLQNLVFIRKGNQRNLRKIKDLL